MSLALAAALAGTVASSADTYDWTGANSANFIEESNWNDGLGGYPGLDSSDIANFTHLSESEIFIYNNITFNTLNLQNGPLVISGGVAANIGSVNMSGGSLTLAAGSAWNGTNLAFTGGTLNLVGGATTETKTLFNGKITSAQIGGTADSPQFAAAGRINISGHVDFNMGQGKVQFAGDMVWTGATITAMGANNDWKFNTGSLSATNSTFDHQRTIMLFDNGGAASSGTLDLKDSRIRTIHRIYFANANQSVTGTLDNSSIENIAGGNGAIYIGFGDNADIDLTLKNGSFIRKGNTGENLHIGGGGTGSVAKFTLEDTSFLETAGGDLKIGQVASGGIGSSTTVTLKGTSQIKANGPLAIGVGGNAETWNSATVTMNPGTSITAAGQVNIGAGGGEGILNATSATITISTSTDPALNIGRDANGRASVRLDDSTLTATKTINIAPSGAVATLDMVNGSAISATGVGLRFGTGNAASKATITVTDSTITAGDLEMGTGGGTASVTLTNSTLTLDSNKIWVGQGSGSKAELIATDSIISTVNELQVGRAVGAGSGTLKAYGSTAITVGGNSVHVGIDAGTALLELHGTSNITNTKAGGSFNIGFRGGSNGTLKMFDDSWLLTEQTLVAAAAAGATTGTLEMAGNAVITATDRFWVATPSTLNATTNAWAAVTLNGNARVVSQGTDIAYIGGGRSSVATVTLNDTAGLSYAGDLQIGRGDYAINATVNVNGAAALDVAGRVVFDAGATNVLNLNLSGGTIVTQGFLKNNTGGVSRITFDGGTLRATADTADFLENFAAADIVVGAGGLTLDTDGHDIGIAGGVSGTGEITKTGAGAFTLGGDNSGFTGAVTIAEGAGVVTSGATLTIVLDGAQGVTGTAVDADNPLAIGGGATLDIEDGASLNVVLRNPGSLAAGTYVYNVFVGAVTYDEDRITLITGSNNYQYTLNSNGTLSLTIVPEPSTYALFGAAGLAGLMLRWRRRKN